MTKFQCYVVITGMFFAFSLGFSYCVETARIGGSLIQNQTVNRSNRIDAESCFDLFALNPACKREVSNEDVRINDNGGSQ